MMIDAIYNWGTQKPGPLPRYYFSGPVYTPGRREQSSVLVEEEGFPGWSDTSPAGGGGPAT